MSAQFLERRNCSRFRRVAEELLSFVLKLKRLDLYMQFDRPLAEDELQKMRSLLKRAAQGEPVEYMTGEVLFYGCTIGVTPDVLIPRPETEILVDLACKELKSDFFAGKTAWDLCTGSGCIGIAVKKACPSLAVTLSDISEKALEVASCNAMRNDVELKVICGDLLSAFKGQKSDIIFCNPPYVKSKEYLTLDPSVKNFEPEGALVGGEDGLDFYKRLKEQLPVFLNPHAKVYFEIGSDQGKVLQELFSEPRWKILRLEKDWAGHDRFFFLEFE